MKSSKMAWVMATLAALIVIGTSGVAAAESEASSSPLEFSLLGGVLMLNQNDTAIPDQSFNIPIAADVTYRLTPNWAIEGDFTWVIPLKQKLDVGSGSEQDRRPPDVLSYQAGVRASLPSPTWTPYLTAGAGAVTFLSNTESDRLLSLSDSKTAFGLNFGGGADYYLTSSWGIRADLRELVAFPSKDEAGLSSNGEADAIWMSRAALGLDYRF
jgi:opacity protein-like surface antigen